MEAPEVSNPNPEIQLNPLVFVPPMGIIFALIILYCLIVISPFGAASASDAIILLGFPAIMAFAAIRSFFLFPRHWVREHKLRDLADVHPELASRAKQVAVDMGVKRPPRLLWTTSEKLPAHCFGTFFHTYVVFPELLLMRLRNEPEQFEAVLTHELAHVRNGDVWRICLADPLLRTSLIGYTLFSIATIYYYSVVAFGQPSPHLYLGIPATGQGPIVAAPILTLPLTLLVALVLMRMLERGSELFADASVHRFPAVELDGKRASLMDAIIRMSARKGSSFVMNQEWPTSRIKAFNSYLFSLRTSAAKRVPHIKKITSLVKRWNMRHPSAISRLESLTSTTKLYDYLGNLPIAAGIVIGFSGLRSATVGILIAPPVAIGVGTAVISLVNIASSFQDSRNHRTQNLMRPLQFVVSYAVTYILVTLPWTIVSYVDRSIGRNWTDDATLGFVLFIWAIVIYVVIVVFLVLFDFLRKRILSFYGLDVIREHPHVMLWAWPFLSSWSILLGSVIVLILSATLGLEMLNFPPLPQGAITIERLLIIYLPIPIVNMVVLGYLAHRFGKRCPFCDSVVRAQPDLSSICESCGHQLLGWLTVH